MAVPDNDFMSFVSDALFTDVQRVTAEHEPRHIRLKHFYDEKPVVINEIEAR